MNDKEMLELAARAAGYEIEETVVGGEARLYLRGSLLEWSPLTEDGDALRLAIDCEIRFAVVLEDSRGWAEHGAYYFEFDWHQHMPSERYDATRRAIVRVASEIGKAMQ